jgi:DNA-binding transcriptional LysR family regulator
LAGETFVDVPVGYGSRSVVDQAFGAARQQRDVGIEVANAEIAVAFARQGLGVAILPDPYLGPGPHLRIVGPGSDRLTWPLSLAVPANRRSSTATRQLAATLENVAWACTAPSG